MNTELKKKWVEALRSGEYKQTQGCLNDKNGFCCLGVLCDISGKGRWEVRDGDVHYVTGLVNSWYKLPLPVKAAIDIDSDVMCDLIRLNDEGKTFLEIADYIEQLP